MSIVEKQANALEKAAEQMVAMAGHLVTLSETCLGLRAALIKIRDTEILSEHEMRQIAKEALK
jgi:hypothetical protein